MGRIERAVDDDLFSSVIHHIIGQQISTKAQQTIWAKLTTELGAITPNTLLACGRERLQAFGTTWKKVDCMLDCAQKIQSGQFDIEALNTMTDEGGHRRIVLLEGDRSVDSGDDLIFVFNDRTFAAMRSSHPAGDTDGLPPQGTVQRAV